MHLFRFKGGKRFDAVRPAACLGFRPHPMEVHHHPKSRAGGWKAHLLEFGMLFAAVTLGFFAENLREHYVERHRAVAYLHSVAADLDADIANIDATLEQSRARHESGQAAMAMYASGEYKQRMADFYFNIRRYSRRVLFMPSVNGIQQLRASGGVRLIGDRRILDGLQRYQVSLELVAATQELMENNMIQFRSKSAQVTDFRVNYAMFTDPMHPDRSAVWTRPPGNPPLFDQDAVHLNEMMNFVLYSSNTENSRILRLNALRAEADALRSLIRTSHPQH
jgi:hypothetical protein